MLVDQWTATERRRPVSVSLLLCSLLPLFATPKLAKASFAQGYSVGNFTLTNSTSTGNGSAMTPDGGISLVLTGSNDGSGEPGTTDFTILSPASGEVSFSYAFATLDDPTYEYAGYLVGSAFTQLADTDGESGTVEFPVTSGERFGFRGGTEDNTGGAGVLTISDFEAPSGSVSAVPEPGSAALCIQGLAVLLLVGAARLARKRGEKS